jgi:hypothetical protein
LFRHVADGHFSSAFVTQITAEARLTRLAYCRQEQDRHERFIARESQSMIEATELQAAVLRRLLKHLNEERPDVQNIDLMNLAGFCRNCLADWYREAASERGLDLSKEEAREAIYGMPFDEWKALHQKEATPEQLAALHAARQHDGHVA